MNKVNEIFGSLEERLHEIKVHQRNLNANIKIKKREMLCYSSVIFDYEFEKDTGIPYNSLRNESRTALNHIHSHDEWFFARYKAGKALDVNESELNRRLNYWISSLYYDHNCRVLEKGTPEEEEKKDWLPAKARKDLRKFFTCSYLDNKHRREAGTHLGYSSARIWWGMHWIDAALVASGAGVLYTIYHMAGEVLS